MIRWMRLQDCDKKAKKYKISADKVKYGFDILRRYIYNRDDCKIKEYACTYYVQSL